MLQTFEDITIDTQVHFWISHRANGNERYTLSFIKREEFVVVCNYDNIDNFCGTSEDGIFTSKS